MKKIMFLAGLLFCISGNVSSALLTITLEGDMFAGGDDDYSLEGAHYVWTSTIDTSAIAYNQTAGTNYNQAWYQYFDTSVEFTNRFAGAADAVANSTFGTTVTTINHDATSSNSDTLRVFSGSFGGEFLGLNMQDFSYFLTSDVYGADGFADIPDGWQSEQLIDAYYDVEFFYGNFNWYGTTGNVLTTSVSSVPVPAAIWLFGSGLLGLVGAARRKKE